MSGRTVGVMIDKTFSMNDKLAIDDALAAWNYAFNGLIQFRVVSTTFDMEPSQITEAMDDGDILVLKINHTSSFIPPSSGETVLAFVDRIGGHEVFVVRDEFEDRSLKAVMMHEIGHLLGARHIADPGHLMSPVYDERFQQCVDWDAADQAAIMQGFDVSRMNYCTYE